MTLDHTLGHLVGMLFVGIALMANPAWKIHATALVHDMRGLVRRKAETWRAAKHDCFTSGVSRSTDGVRRCLSLSTDVSLNVADVVTTECALDGVEVGKSHATAIDATLRRPHNRVGSLP